MDFGTTGNSYYNSNKVVYDKYNIFLSVRLSGIRGYVMSGMWKSRLLRQSLASHMWCEMFCWTLDYLEMCNRLPPPQPPTQSAVSSKQSIAVWHTREPLPAPPPTPSHYYQTCVCYQLIHHLSHSLTPFHSRPTKVNATSEPPPITLLNIQSADRDGTHLYKLIALFTDIPPVN